MIDRFEYCNKEIPDEAVIFTDGILTIINEDCIDDKTIYLYPEYDEPLSLATIKEKYPKVKLLIYEDMLSGAVYSYGNHKAEGIGWEKVGETIGYA